MNLDPARLQQFQNLVGGSGMIIRDGYQVWAWGDLDMPRNWASASKPVLSTLLFLAVNDSRCFLSSRMGEYLSGGSAKDRAITFQHLANMTSGYSRGEGAGAAYAYNDHAINLYGYALFHGVYDGEPSDVMPDELSFLGFQDSFLVSDEQYGRLVGVSIRDFARIGYFWLRDGAWNGVQRIPAGYFQLVTNQVGAGMPISFQDGAESWNLGTFGGGDQMDFEGQGLGNYGYNFWVNTNGFWPGAPSSIFAAVGHSGGENCVVIPSAEMVAVGVGSWGHPSTAAVQLLLQAVQGAVGVAELESSSWGRIKAGYAR
jgi:CubicO group peptidase (beta-lactamase class C family)